MAQLSWSSPNTPEEIVPQRFLSLPFRAFAPNPSHGQELSAEDVPVLSWKSGIKADTHTVYFGTSLSDVSEGATPVSIEQPANTYDPVTGGDITEWTWETTYYWRIDEVNDANLWEGDVWSFTTGNYALVEDFEFYVETGSSSGDPNKLRVVWKDGYSTKPDFESGSNIMLARLARSELTLEYSREYLHYEDDDHYEGEQALAFYYDNDGSTFLPYWEQWARDDIYQAGRFSEISAFTDGGDDLGIGRDWLRQDIKALSLWFKGNPTRTGSAEIIGSNVTIIANGAGMDIGPGGTADYHDEFHYAYKLLQGSGGWPGYGDITARVGSIDPGAEAGVMMREGPFPDSKYVMVVATPGEVSLQFRDAKGETSTILTKTGLTLPQWVKLSRNEMMGAFLAYHANDWAGEPNLPWYEVPDAGQYTVSSNIMAPDVYVGLCVTSDNADEMSAAVFSNVSITAPTGSSVVGDWQCEDIGIISNDPEPMYVALEDTSLKVGVVYHPDSNAALIEDWTNWNIKVQDFKDNEPLLQLDAINKVHIGFGDRVTQPGGEHSSGVVYFDDIRLYRPRFVPGVYPPLPGNIVYDGVVDYKDLAVIAGEWLLSDEIIPTTDPGDANLVAHYEFEGNANDSSGNNYHGTAMGGPVYVDGVLGQALDFEYDNDTSVEIEPFDVEGSGITLACWIKLESQSRTDARIISKCNPDDSSTGGHWWKLGTHSNLRLRCRLKTGGTTVERNSANYTLSLDEWHHVAMTYNGSQVQLYKDTQSVGSWAQSGTVDVNSLIPVAIGNHPVNGDRAFDGLIDDVRIYDRALSDDEVAWLADIDTNPDGLYVPLVSPANIYDTEAEGLKWVNFRDFAVLANDWLEEEPYWP
ncbi:hypothetical protein ES703_69231 [subsurface metagenome]